MRTSEDPCRTAGGSLAVSDDSGRNAHRCSHSVSIDSGRIGQTNYFGRFSKVLPMCLCSPIGATQRPKGLPERGVRVIEQLLKIRLEPLPGFRSRLQGIGIAAKVDVSRGARVAGAVTLSARLDPDESVDVGVARVGGRPHAEAGTDGVAPVTPFELAGRLLAAAALIDDELGIPTPLAEQRGEGVDVAAFVVDGVSCLLSVWPFEHMEAVRDESYEWCKEPGTRRSTHCSWKR